MKKSRSDILKITILGAIFLILLYTLLFQALEISGNVILNDKNYISCSDKDSGLNYKSSNSIYTKYSSKEEVLTKYFYDVCISSKKIKEYYCSGNSPAYETYACPKGCSNNACNPLVTD